MQDDGREWRFLQFNPKDFKFKVIKKTTEYMKETQIALLHRQSEMWKKNDDWSKKLNKTFVNWEKEERKKVEEEWENYTEEEKKQFEYDLEEKKKEMHDLCYGFGGGKILEMFLELVEEGDEIRKMNEQLNIDKNAE